ncbi:MAG: hypothetical protein ACI4MH_04025 [Candidatus Coproplasma sp.]
MEETELQTAEETELQAAEEKKEPANSQAERKPLTPDELIADNMAYFNFYQSAPKIFTIIFAVLFGIASLIAAITLENAGYFFLLAIFGVIICFAIFFLLKLFFAHKILHISYLIKIEENTRKDK